jgi:hypothetical protein
MEWFIKIGKQYGVTGFLAIWLFWTNQRLTKVEDELYKCYDRSVTIKSNQSSRDIIISEKQYAVLTKKEKYVKEKTNSKNS